MRWFKVLRSTVAFGQRFWLRLQLREEGVRGPHGVRAHVHLLRSVLKQLQLQIDVVDRLLRCDRLLQLVVLLPSYHRPPW